MSKKHKRNQTIYPFDQMKKFLFILFALLSASNFSRAFSLAGSEEAARIGNRYFSEKDFKNAAEQYQKALKSGESAQIYFNLGQTYAMLDKPGFALAYFLKAEKLAPRWNLNNKAIQQLYAENTSLLQIPSKWYQTIFKSFTQRTWSWIAAILFWGCVWSAFYCFIINKKAKMRFIFIIFNIFFIGTITLLWVNQPYNSACILPERTIGRFAPNKKSPMRYDWPMGTLCWIKSELQSFYFVSTMQGEDGWIEKNQLITLK